ncbi:hypothetical protein ACFLZB_01900 [Nanoarchaeota archaeon]
MMGKSILVVLIFFILLSVSVSAQQSHPLNQLTDGTATATSTGFIFEGNVAHPNPVLKVSNSNPSGLYGIYSEVLSGYAIYGYGNGAYWGVKGEASADSTGARGVSGVYSGSSDGYGIYGESTSTGYAGYFTGGSGIWVSCPSGFQSIESGRRQLGCMQTNEEGTGVDWWAANNDCFITYGGKLPSSSEWYLAANHFILNNESDDDEWVDDFCWFNANEQYGVMGSGGINQQACIGGGETYPAYRCWLPR